MKRVGNTLTYYSDEQLARETDLLTLVQRFVNDESISGDQRVRNLSLFLKPQVYARLIYLHDLYRKIVDVPGSILEFGVHFGASLATLAALRNCYDYFNMSRSVIGFDTFSGFPSVTAEDADNRVGDYGVTDTDKSRLDAILSFVDTLSPHPSVSRFQLVEGDATKTFGPWLEANPQTIVAFAHFDMDLYEPTKAVLDLIRPRLVKGSLLVFDELNHPAFPGETLAVIEAFGLNNLALRRHPMQPFAAYAVYGD